ncbi:MAG: RluA family pseudouridine synthase [Fusobacteriaceae bacterium]|jgi:23S rRNA pseudouridine1911/1915/1917 synthase|nr:RluA family pseudouridine synthase [Fusobacteriaceae bacterium]
MDDARETLSYQASPQDKDKRLDLFLLESMGDATRSRISRLIDQGLVLVEGVPAKKSGLSLKGGEKILVTLPAPAPSHITPENLPIEILYEDPWLAVINKRAGVVVHPGCGNRSGTLANGILYHMKELSGAGGELRPGIVHRLDKDTSGLLLIAKTDKAHLALSGMFSRREIKKTSLAVAKGIFQKKSDTIETLIARDPKNRKRMAVSDDHGKSAVTRYTVLDEQKKHSLLLVAIDTGRTHQIRVHMKYCRHPLAGDALYGNGDDPFPRQMLHAWKLSFTHPFTAERVTLKAAPPGDFLQCLRTCGLSAEKIPE